MTGWDDEEAAPPDPWDPWQAGDQGPPEVPVLEVYVAEEAEPVGTILGPDGEALHTVYAADERLPFGFHP